MINPPHTQKEREGAYANVGGAPGAMPVAKRGIYDRSADGASTTSSPSSRVTSPEVAGRASDCDPTPESERQLDDRKIQVDRETKVQEKRTHGGSRGLVTGGDATDAHRVRNGHAAHTVAGHCAMAYPDDIMHGIRSFAIKDGD
jgi:hypothetical protein